MGSEMKETIFTERVVAGIKKWHGMAKRSLFSKETGDGSNSPTTTSASPSPLMASPRAGSSWWTHRDLPPIITMPSPAAPSSSSPSPVTLNRRSRGGSSMPTVTGSASSSQPRNAAAMFEFPTRRQELEEIQKVTEEMMGTSRRGGGFEGGGEMSFRMWWKQEMISPIGGRSSSRAAAAALSD